MSAFSDTAHPTMDQDRAAVLAPSNSVLGAPAFPDIGDLRIRMTFKQLLRAAAHKSPRRVDPLAICPLRVVAPPFCADTGKDSRPRQTGPHPTRWIGETQLSAAPPPIQEDIPARVDLARPKGKGAANRLARSLEKPS